MCGRSDAQNNHICITGAGFGEPNEVDHIGGYTRTFHQPL